MCMYKSPFDKFGYIFCMQLTKILYKNKYWRETKFGKLANFHPTAKFKSHQYFAIPFYS